MSERRQVSGSDCAVVLQARAHNVDDSHHDADNGEANDPQATIASPTAAGRINAIGALRGLGAKRLHACGILNRRNRLRRVSQRIVAC